VLRESKQEDLEMTDRRQIVDALLAGDASAATALLDPAATFHSPVADYHGAERIGTVWNAVVQLLTDARTTAIHETPEETVAFFTAKVHGRPADGILRVVGTRDVTLMLRPLSTLLPAVKRMAELLPT
jgi:hypothetical protein